MDPQCELVQGDAAVVAHVYDDYSIKLILQDVEYSVGKIQDRQIKMQLLERGDCQKWWVWLSTGLITNKQVKTKQFAFFDKAEAKSMFETKFEFYTDNKWAERLFFISKPGKYLIMSEEKEKERLEIAMTAETEVRALLS